MYIIKLTKFLPLSFVAKSNQAPVSILTLRLARLSSRVGLQTTQFFTTRLPSGSNSGMRVSRDRSAASFTSAKSIHERLGNVLRIAPITGFLQQARSYKGCS